MQISIQYDFLPRQNTIRCQQVMDLFGVDHETGTLPIADRFEIPIEPGQLICFTGDSGSGKSSLVHAVQRELSGVLDIDTLTWDNIPLIDCFDVPVKEAMSLLSTCGLSEAQLMLRTPAELSDGQRYRFRLALALSKKPDWIIADEFTATLDRTLAHVISCNLRKLCDQQAVGFLLATTHQDVLPDLDPDLHVQCQLASPPVLNFREQTDSPRKKKESTSRRNSGSAGPPKPTGRISLGGIIDPITLDC